MESFFKVHPRMCKSYRRITMDVCSARGAFPLGVVVVLICSVPMDRFILSASFLIPLNVDAAFESFTVMAGSRHI